ncbi:Rieske 2Fe-2S domain-containing protein [Variovorax sp. H27-G14]|uniref:Rieske 2Fe-2S domain-containing protein n=1 Tax=Variovorax sp. H27-G14 TaxID=3111914 RepID=UPI0038FD3ECD
MLAKQWFPVGRVDQVTARPRQVVLLNLRLAVYRMAEGVRIARDMCPHRGLPLSSGRIEGEQLVCAYHGLRFGAAGQCVEVPEKLAPKTAKCFSLTMFPAEERHGLVWTCLMPQGEPRIPHIASSFGASDTLDEANHAAEIQLQIEHWLSLAKFGFMEPELTTDPGYLSSLQSLAMNEYQRLLDAMNI